MHLRTKHGGKAPPGTSGRRNMQADLKNNETNK